MSEAITTVEEPVLPAADLRGRAPLWAVLAFTFLGSLGTGIVTTGVFFIAEHAYGFGDAERFSLGLVEGLLYVGGALGTGPLLRRLRGRWPGLSTRAALAAVCSALGLLCLIPVMIGVPRDPALAPHWPIWLLLILYSPVTGALWPIVESYLSGGRSGQRLRSALGRFNITWSVAVVVGMVAIGPTVERWPAELIAFLALVHLGSLALVAQMGREPGRHIHEEHEPHPPVYTQLLTTFRILLPVTYLVLMALAPYLPRLMGSARVEPEWQAPLAATWTAARVVSFLVLERWHAWHGRWYPAAAGTAALLGGFGVAVLGPVLSGPELAAPLLILGLAAFGIGMAVIYTGALYYALVVGKAEVEAGGTHEALIGVGYTVGPLCGLLALGGSAAGLYPRQNGGFETAMLVLVGVIALGAVATAARRSWRVVRG